ncbi:MAG: beta strand repeat-containing protein [Rhodoblastus sp.]
MNNIATATSGATTSPAANLRINAFQSPVLSIAKTPNPTTYSTVGAAVAFTYTVRNAGNVTLTQAVTVTDNKIASVSCPALPSGGLAPNATLTCSGSYSVTQADIDAGFVTNTASATSGTTTSPGANATITASQSPALSIVKTSPSASFATAGQTITYSYTVRNAGNTTLTSAVTIADDKIATVTCPALPSGGLAPNATLTCSGSYTVRQSDIDNNTLTNTATATSGVTVSPGVSLTIPAAQAPGLSVLKSAGAATYVSVGQIVPYTYQVTNVGNTTLTQAVTITDNKIASVSCPALPSGGLAPGGAITCSANYTVTQADLDAATLTNLASARSNTTSSPNASKTISAVSAPALTIAKSTTSTGYAAVGQSIPYSYKVTNAGNVTLTQAVTVTDNKIASVSCPALPSGGLAPGAFVTCTGNYTVTQADLDAGQITNIAFVKSGATISPNGSVMVAAQQAPALTILKGSTATGFNAVGQVIPYTYLVSNTGNVSITAPISVVDDKIPSVSCPAAPSGGLAPNTAITCTGSYTLTQGDLDGSGLTNSAYAKAGALPAPAVSKTLTPTRTPGLQIAKTTTTTGFNAVGQVIPFTYRVTNSGNVSLAQAMIVIDDKIASVSCPASPSGMLAPGETIVCTGSYSVVQADLDRGSVTNIATAKAGTTTSPPGTVTVPAVQTPALAVVKTSTATSYATVGQTVAYNYVVTNKGNTTLTQPVAVNDNKIATVACPALPTGGLAPNASLTCTASYTVTQADLDAGSLTNTATTTSGSTTSPSVALTINAAQQGGLSIVKTSTGAQNFAAVGETLTYSYKVSNSGNVTVTQAISVTDDRIASVSCPALPSGGLAPAASITCTASYTVTQADLDAGSVANNAYATSGALRSNTATVKVDARQRDGLAIVKQTSATSYVKVGDVLPFTYVVTNTSNHSLTQPVTIADDKIATVTCPAMPTGGLAPGASLTCTGNYTVVGADLDAGQVTNVARARSGAVVSPDVSVTVNANQQPKLTLTQTAVTSTVIDNGNGTYEASFRLVVTNTGNISLTSLRLIDDFNATLPSGLRVTAARIASMVSSKRGALTTRNPGYSGSSANPQLISGSGETLEVDESITFVLTFTLMGQVDQTIVLPNKADAQASTPAGSSTPTISLTATSQAQVNVPVSLPLVVAKTTPLADVMRGQIVPYTITIRSNSPVARTDLTLVDSMPAGFTYKKGTASINGVAREPQVAGPQLRWTRISVPAKGVVTIKTMLVVGVGVGTGEFINQAWLIGPNGEMVSNIARASVRLGADPTFDCTDIIGKVFDDSARPPARARMRGAPDNDEWFATNGYPSSGKPGIPNVRLATVKGQLVTTDAYGRFHIACADAPDNMRGSNFILKLDVRTLPTGYRVTTENPRVVRITPGKMVKINFGAALNHVARIEVSGRAFISETELDDRWMIQARKLLALLREKQGMIRLSYRRAPDENPALARARLQALSRFIKTEWDEMGAPYRLSVETEVFTQRN